MVESECSEAKVNLAMEQVKAVGDRATPNTEEHITEDSTTNRKVESECIEEKQVTEDVRTNKKVEVRKPQLSSQFLHARPPHP